MSVPSGDGLNIKKSEDFSKWYRQLILKSGLISETDMSGFYILLNDTMEIWKNIQSYFDSKIKLLGVKSAYFPLLIPKSCLEKEVEHINGFFPEVAWVTKTGNTELEEHFAIRPTSETIIYPMYSKWINSYKQLPMKYNSWCNVLRWEFKRPVPFIRSREFLWQEGHSAFATLEEANVDTKNVLDLYKDIYENLLAVPVIQGYKTEVEKFAGAEFTMTCECYIPGSDRAVQAATSHNLGNKFSKMFNIKYINAEDNENYVYQTSWGLTTRSIGIMIMTHSDDKGLVIPPKVAPIQIVIIPHYDKKGLVENFINKIENLLASSDISYYTDSRKKYRPGYKYAEWELKGVPLRLEVGMKEYESNNIKSVRRDNNRIEMLDFNNLLNSIHNIFNNMQTEMLESARKHINIQQCHSKKQFSEVIDSGNKLVLVPSCDTVECEQSINIEGVKSLCKPLDQPELLENCFNCDNKCVCWTLYGKSY